ncbi:diphosphomevalonate decarboxylase [Pendulispora brunnea]|uniref:diphosphomevalonate decarboxylase n=1 Tax=Pendulispora brunnea TaxID=2905690 RepID=A0ABZ2JYD7_9BACT
MNRAARAIAHSNIALSKYWGKRPDAYNSPAVPSLSVTLEGLATHTRVEFRDDIDADRLVVNGREERGRGIERAAALLDGLRREAGITARASIDSVNDFPTASGLASSASGFAALAVAAVGAAGVDWDLARTSELARLGSTSASRSVFGGFVELDAGASRAHPLFPRDHLPLVVLVCVADEGPKAVASHDGMRITMQKSPYARAWLEEAPRLHARLRDALRARDFAGVGELAEASALAMHASAMAAGIVYWNAVTLDALATVRALRAEGTLVYATMDAGPHVKVLVRPEDVAHVRPRMAASRGVVRIIEAKPGGNAELVPSS